MKTSDADIREVLHCNLNTKYGSDNDTIILDELVVCHGKARVDVAVINGSMIGYEIKSEKDTLDRLPNQINAYNKVFDNISIVIGNNHAEEVQSMVPEWWGIYIASSDDNNIVRIDSVRPPKQNETIDAFELVKFLLRPELLELIDHYGLEKRLKRIPKFKIWPNIVENVPFKELKDYVRICLKSRRTSIVD